MTDQPTEAALPPLDELIIRAVTMCGHSIDSNRLVLHFDAKKPGHNALNQLHRRIVEAIDSDRAARALTQGEVERVCSPCRHEALLENEGACAGCGYAAPYDRWEPVAAPSALAASPVEMQANMAPMIAGALFDFLGFLTTSEEQWKFSAYDEAGPAVIAIEQWAAKKGLSLDEANVSGWRASLAAIPVAAKVQP